MDKVKVSSHPKVPPHQRRTQSLGRRTALPHSAFPAFAFRPLPCAWNGAACDCECFASARLFTRIVPISVLAHNPSRGGSAPLPLKALRRASLCMKARAAWAVCMDCLARRAFPREPRTGGESLASRPPVPAPCSLASLARSFGRSSPCGRLVRPSLETKLSLCGGEPCAGLHRRRFLERRPLQFFRNQTVRRVLVFVLLLTERAPAQSPTAAHVSACIGVVRSGWRACMRCACVCARVRASLWCHGHWQGSACNRHISKCRAPNAQFLTPIKMASRGVILINLALAERPPCCIASRKPRRFSHPLSNAAQRT